MNLAIIPARGGSKRVPRKNVRSFNGKPMIGWPIEAALRSGLFDHVVVSTDDDEIAEVARACGAEVPFMRPPALADDHTGTGPVVRHAIGAWEYQGPTPSLVCCIYATSPLLDERYLRQGLELLENEPQVDFAFSAGRFSFPIQRALRILPGGGVEPFSREDIRKRSQDLEPAYHDAGQFYWGRREAWLNPQKRVFSPSSRPVVLPAYRIQDIDTEEDWRRAELMQRVIRSLESA